MTHPQPHHDPEAAADQQPHGTTTGAEKPHRGWFPGVVRWGRSRPDQGHDDDGASWGKVHNAVGAADFALGHAPGVAGQDRHEGAPVQDVQAEGSQDQGPDSELAAVGIVREAPTATAVEFLHLGVAVLDRAPLSLDDHAVPLAERMYRPRSGTKRTLQLTCSVEPAERTLIDLAAAKAGRSRSAFLADSALSVAQELVVTDRPDGFVPLPDREAITRLTELSSAVVRHLGRIGGNLNQVTAQGYSTLVAERVLEVLDELQALAVESRLAYQRVLPGGRRGA
ncbi:plasmid mobilization protein [Kitasatospora cineracea]